MIGTLGEMASTQLNNIYTHKIKKRHENKRKQLLKILSGVLLRELQQQRFEFSSRFASRKPDVL